MQRVTTPDERLFSSKNIDYDETYSPVARYSLIRFLLAKSVKRYMIVHQMDAVTAFLQDELKPEGRNLHAATGWFR